VLVPGGEHEVRFFYRPTTVYLAGAVSLSALAIILLLLFYGDKQWSLIKHLP
jgi:hypothetical protein